MKADSKVLDAIHGALARALLKRIEDGEATAADLNVARQLLKDNGVGVGLTPNQEDLDKLEKKLPFQSLSDLHAEDTLIQ